MANNQKNTDAPLTRRRLLTAGAALPLASAAAAAATIRGEVPWREGESAAPTAATSGPGASPNPTYAYFTAAESAFIEAAVDRLIPQDDLGPGAVEAGVPTFIDRQLAGDYGRGARMYMQGPWAKGEPTQGYQTRMTPAGMYRAAIREIDEAATRDSNNTFAKLAPADQDALLKKLEGGTLALPTADAKAFFTLLLQNTMEGFWSDPIYGGNRDMVGWKLIGFPGARYDHSPYVSKHGEAYPLPPVGLKGRVEWINKG
jgi:gluconate 2-dehydrogenase gamma chain